MGRHPLRLLLCSTAALGLLAFALFGKSWFTATTGFGPTIELDLRNAKICHDGICASVSLGQMRGAYPTVASVAFWSSVIVLLLVLVQCGIRLLGGTANPSLTRIGYLVAFLALATGFAAGFVFGPESQTMGQMAGVTVERTIAPGLFSLGTLLAMIALYFSTSVSDPTDDSSYKPVVVRKDLQSDRLPVTPLTGVKKLPAPSGSLPRTPVPASSPVPAKAPLPDEIPFDASYMATDIDLSPSADPSRARTPTGQPLEVSIGTPLGPEPARTTKTSQPIERIEPIEIVHRPDPRSHAPSAAPLTEDDLVGVDQRARTLDLAPSRTRTPSSDVAARLSAAAAEAATHISVKPPLPVAEPTRPDEIAVAPESGLRIRKRTPTGGSQPLTREEPSPSIAPPEVGLHFHKKPPSVAPPAPETLPASAFAPPPDADSPPRKKTPSMAGVPMPSVTAEGLADVLAAQPIGASTPVSKSPTVPPDFATTSTPASKAPTIPPATKPTTRTASFPPPAITRTTTPTNSPALARTSTPSAPAMARTTTPMQPTIATAKTQTLPPPVSRDAKTQTLPPATIAGARARSQTTPPPISEKHKTLPPPMASVLPAPTSASGSGSLPALSDRRPTTQGSGSMPVTDSDLPIAQDSGALPGSIAEAARVHADSQPPATVPMRPSSSSIPSGTETSARPSGTYSQQYPRTARPDDVKTSEYKPFDTTTSEYKPFDTTTSEYKPFETKTTEYKPVELPEHVRGAINYSVLTAELSGAGIHARREDGLVKFVAWGEIVGIVARRLPPAAPYDGATIVDLVSTAGSTLRILPWTQIKGHQFAESTVARARELVNIVAAQSLDARLDGPTKLFADSEGQAPQLPDAAMLALHDQKLA